MGASVACRRSPVVKLFVGDDQEYECEALADAQELLESLCLRGEKKILIVEKHSERQSKRQVPESLEESTKGTESRSPERLQADVREAE